MDAHYRLEAGFARLRRSQSPLSLILFDLDFFKPYNDHYGHVAGDECLRRIDALIADIAGRAPALAARYGGEEFALILPETDTQGAQKGAERIRRGIADLAIPHAASNIADHVTASLGVVTLVLSSIESPTAVIRLADEQLYRAKANGRNRVAAGLDHRSGHPGAGVQGFSLGLTGPRLKPWTSEDRRWPER